MPLQWWDLKARYFDTVLLFKTGKFYELFHMDADLGVSVTDFAYMKGPHAHAGVPESAYGSTAARLIRAGHKVACVEQTETLDQWRARKQDAGGNGSPVVNREVCSVQSVGTRTFCVLVASSAVEPDHLQIDGVALEHLEILWNRTDAFEKGTLWAKLNRAKSPQGFQILICFGILTLLSSKIQALLARKHPVYKSISNI